MLISCTSCNSQYLVNSLDLKPNGRDVQCVKCGNQWYQDSKLKENEQINQPLIAEILPTNSENKKNNLKQKIPNLPSTYVMEKKVSVLNSILIILFVIILISGFWVIRNLDINSLVLIKFYFAEFTFNLNLIFHDIAKIIYQILN